MRLNVPDLGLTLQLAIPMLHKKMPVFLVCALRVPLLTIAAIFALSANANADTISQDIFFRLNADAPAESLSFSAFDSSLGLLNSVGITFVATRRHDLSVWNFSGDPQALSYEASLSGTALILNGNSFTFANVSDGPGNTPVLAPVSVADFLAEFIAGRSDFMMGLDPTFAAAFQPGMVLSSLDGGIPAGAFDGLVNLSYVPGVFSAVSTNSFVGSLEDITGTVTVSYSFTPVSVSDSSPGLFLLGGVWLGLAEISRRRRNGKETIGSRGLS